MTGENINRLYYTLLWSLLVIVLSAGSVCANDSQVTDAKLRVLPGDMPAAGYFNLHNTSDEPMVLVGAESPAFDKIELHLSSNEGGMASMKSIPQLEVAPGKSIEFATKGYHLMLMNRKQGLSMGDEIIIDLQFEDESHLPVNFEVVSPTSM